MKEIELKVLEINKKLMIKKLLALGAKKVMKRTLFVEKIYDFSDRRLDKHLHLLRLRQEGKKIFFTFKKLREKSKFRVADEYQVEVNDYKTMEDILAGLNFVLLNHREKYRTTFKLGRAMIEIDEYPKIPVFLEIEANKKDLVRALQALDIPFSRTTNMVNKQVIDHYGLDGKLLKFK